MPWRSCARRTLEAYRRALPPRGLFLAKVLTVVLGVVVIIVVAAAIKLTSRGPVLFRQRRVGLHGATFNFLKFRSMVVNAEALRAALVSQTKKDGTVYKMRYDPRITRVGRLLRRWSLDELPQLWNVFVGDMSIVGPRPERPAFVEQLQEQYPYYRERHRMRPGLTGWAQISYQYGDSTEDAYRKLEYDLYYVKNYSIFLDLLIILHTVHVVLTGKGAH